MNAARHHVHSLDAYFTAEAHALEKHEWADGQIFLMAGGSLRHNALSANVLGVFATGARGGACRALSSDQRISTGDGLYTYADATLACGELTLGREQTLLDPVVLVEVLSNATRAYDRGEKLSRYQTIPSLRHVLLVEQERIDVEHWRCVDGAWSRTVHTALADRLVLDPPGLVVALADVYDGFDRLPA